MASLTSEKGYSLLVRSGPVLATLLPLFVVHPPLVLVSHPEEEAVPEEEL